MDNNKIPCNIRKLFEAVEQLIPSGRTTDCTKVRFVRLSRATSGLFGRALTICAICRAPIPSNIEIPEDNRISNGNLAECII